MKYLLLLIACLVYSSALVSYKKLQKGANGCKTEKGEEIKVGAFVQDEKVCGVFHCRTKEGDALIHYCQQPVTFAKCRDRGVLTSLDFPQCCWTCVRNVDCTEDGKPIEIKTDT